MWKNLSHPNVTNIIGVPDTLDNGRFAVISKWMVNGNITALVGYNRMTVVAAHQAFFRLWTPLRD